MKVVKPEIKTNAVKIIGRVAKARNNMIKRIQGKKLINRRNYKLWLTIEFERIPVK